MIVENFNHRDPSANAVICYRQDQYGGVYWLGTKHGEVDPTDTLEQCVDALREAIDDECSTAVERCNGGQIMILLDPAALYKAGLISYTEAKRMVELGTPTDPNDELKDLLREAKGYLTGGFGGAYLVPYIEAALGDAQSTH